MLLSFLLRGSENSKTVSNGVSEHVTSPSQEVFLCNVPNFLCYYEKYQIDLRYFRTLNQTIFEYASLIVTSYHLHCHNFFSY